MELFKWVEGRQPRVEYKKFCFLYTRIRNWGFDGYILKYEPGTRLPFHTDPVDGKMWRLNITLWGKSIFFIESSIGIKVYTRKINLFRPDIQSHALGVITKTYKLSLGFAKFKEKSSGNT